jgi:pilus assembly protein CpaC
MKKQKLFSSWLIKLIFIAVSFNLYAAEPKKETQPNRIGNFVSSGIEQDSIDESDVIKAYRGKARVIKLKSPVKRVAVGDPRVLDFILLSPTQLYVTGKAIGSTNILIWYANGTSMTYNAEISVDLSPLRASLARDLPNETDIVVNASSDSIVISGSVADAIAAGTALNLTEYFLKTMNRFSGSVATNAPGGGGEALQSTTNVNIVNLLKIRDPQQVMLEVKIAEVNKTLLDKLGVKYSTFGSRDNPGKWKVLSGVSSTGGVTTGGDSTSVSTFLSLLFSDKTTGVNLTAEETDSLLKTLAEPTILAMSGQEGSFLSGGRIFIPIPQSLGNVTLQEKEYGVGLKFTPTVLDNGRINLKVSPEVSTLNPTSVDSITSGATTSFPAFTTNRLTTTVQLKQGETLVIGGLLDNQDTMAITKVPMLGDLPVLGTLFRSTSYQKKKSELVVVVRPSLVKATADTPTLPTDTHVSPSRFEFFLNGKTESSKTKLIN